MFKLKFPRNNCSPILENQALFKRMRLCMA
uniref:Uncharacterized protein n=1 Tax=Heterorhabditis bacteriophora TaxID=37862 RepID=A0A1I7WAE2_HETBA